MTIDTGGLAADVLEGRTTIAAALQSLTMEHERERQGIVREILCKPAFDKRAPEPSKNYGIGGVHFVWILKGPKGGITWGIFTNWLLPHVRAETDARTLSAPFDKMDLKIRYHPSGDAVEYHSRYQKYAGQEKRADCALVPDNDGCYFDVGFTQGDDVMKILVERGSEGVWKWMQQKYDELPEAPPA